MELRPHDLLRIRGMEDLYQELPFPDWAKDSIWRTPWVVVRRAMDRSGFIPVGIRGIQRGLRCAAWLSPIKIIEVISPALLVDPTGWAAIYRDDRPAPVQSLLSITPLLDHTGFEWGPTGSLGFELATGIPSIKPNSDLDLVVEVPQPISIPAARSLLAGMEALSTVRLDVQMNTPAGGVAWKEYCKTEQVLVKTAIAPVLRKKYTLWD